MRIKENLGKLQKSDLVNSIDQYFYGSEIYSTKWNIMDVYLEDSVFYEVPCVASELVLKFVDVKTKLVYVPNFDFVCSVDLTDRDNYTVLINIQKSGSVSFNELMKTKCVDMFNRHYMNRICTYDVERDIQFDNTAESDYIYSIINNMLSVFDDDNIEKSLDMLKNRVCEEFYYKPKDMYRYFFVDDYNALQFIVNNKDISLVGSMYFYINKLTPFEKLIAMYYFNKYEIIQTGITYENVIEYMKDRFFVYDEKLEIFNNALTEKYKKLLYKISDLYKHRIFELKDNYKKKKYG